MTSDDGWVRERRLRGMESVGEAKDEVMKEKLGRYKGEKASRITEAQGGDGNTLRDGTVLKDAGSQLSKLDPMPVLLPNVPYGQSRFKIIMVAVGYEHTVLLTSCQRVMTFGDGEYGQLGQGTTEGSIQPNFVTSMRKNRCLDAASLGCHPRGFANIVRMLL